MALLQITAVEFPIVDPWHTLFEKQTKETI
jgi:hypothetical protein